MSAFTSIKEAAKDILGWASFVSFIVEEKFRNIDHIRNVKCPVFIMHGLLDELIPYQHAETLAAACSTKC
jgi:abhydrolase domain-containing protein 17